MIDNSVLKRLAIQCGAEVLTNNALITFEGYELQAFAQAVIENYKASLVPVVYTWDNDGVDKYTNDEHYIDAMPMHIKLTPLYALPTSSKNELPSGETK